MRICIINLEQVIWLAENEKWVWHLNLFSIARVNYNTWTKCALFFGITPMWLSCPAMLKIWLIDWKCSFDEMKMISCSRYIINLPSQHKHNLMLSNAFDGWSSISWSHHTNIFCDLVSEYPLSVVQSIRWYLWSQFGKKVITSSEVIIGHYSQLSSSWFSRNKLLKCGITFHT